VFYAQRVKVLQKSSRFKALNPVSNVVTYVSGFRFRPEQKSVLSFFFFFSCFFLCLVVCEVLLGLGWVAGDNWRSIMDDFGARSAFKLAKMFAKL
jgi:hypothetical protein